MTKGITSYTIRELYMVKRIRIGTETPHPQNQSIMSSSQSLQFTEQVPVVGYSSKFVSRRVTDSDTKKK